MRFLSLHNYAKFRCFISINDKIINNLLRWGVFSQIFYDAAKLWIRAKNVLELKWWHGHLYHRAKFGGNRATHVGARGWNVMFSLFLFLPAGSAAGSSAGISFTHGPILGFFAPQGRYVAPIKVKFDREERTYGPLLDRFRGGVYGPQNWKKSNFTNIIAPKGRVPCTIFIKFT